MLKIRIIAVLLAILLTIGTAYLFPMAIYYYKTFINGLTKDQQVWFNLLQAGLGAAIALFSFWLWRKNKPKA
jgi:hypothetical protein